jgi:sugar phosphate isomerase/epimerase
VIRPGLCSVTLRALTVDEVARLAGACGLEAVEWGADVHVPPGDTGALARARAAARAAGVANASYGSYLFATGVVGADVWRPVLDTAAALGAPNVRVWAPFGDGSRPEGYVEALRACAADADGRDLTLSLEFHGGTATATVAGVQALLDEVGAPNLRTYWQPPYWRGPTTPERDAGEVTALGAHLLHLHVYEWAGPENRRPLAEGAGRWRAVLDAARRLDGDRVALLEFVPGDEAEALRRDAATLRAWLA